MSSEITHNQELNMKKLSIVAFILVAFSISNAQAQNPIRKGEKQLNFGTGASVFGIPFYVSMDFGIHEDISIGPIVSFRSYRERVNVAGTSYNYAHNIFGFGFTGDYHFNNLLDIPREFDIYAGATVGYYIWNTADVVVGGTTVVYNGNPAAVGLNPHVGARYNFNPKWSVQVQVDAGTHTGAMGGLTMKL